MKIYNRITNKFEQLNNQEFYLIVRVDELREDKAGVIHLIDTTTSLKLPLNCEDDFNTFKSVELFKKSDINFAKYLDFFSIDNISSLNEILSSN